MLLLFFFFKQSRSFTDPTSNTRVACCRSVCIVYETCIIHNIYIYYVDVDIPTYLYYTESNFEKLSRIIQLLRKVVSGNGVVCTTNYNCPLLFTVYSDLSNYGVSIDLFSLFKKSCIKEFQLIH